jgi:glucose 1-dehydrogenase
MGSLDGKVAILSGGLGDIGQAIALELAQRGAAVALGDRPVRGADERIDSILNALTGLGVPARYDTADVAENEQVERWIASVEKELGIPDLIIPNAAVVTLAGIAELKPADWDRELQVNLSGAFYLARAGACRLADRKMSGRIVFIGSWVGHAPQTHIPAYCVSKAGIRMLCRCMAREFAAAGILCNEVAPGNVDAGLSAQLFRREPERRVRALATVPVGTLTEPEEVAWQVANLCEPQNRQMTGSVVLMDGGLSLNS